MYRILIADDEPLITQGLKALIEREEPEIDGIAAVSDGEEALDKLEVIDTYTYKMGMVQGNYSFGTAMSMMKSVLSVGLLLISNFIVKRVRGNSIF